MALTSCLYGASAIYDEWMRFQLAKNPHEGFSDVEKPGLENLGSEYYYSTNGDVHYSNGPISRYPTDVIFERILLAHAQVSPMKFDEINNSMDNRPIEVAHVVNDANEMICSSASSGTRRADTSTNLYKFAVAKTNANPWVRELEHLINIVTSIAFAVITFVIVPSVAGPAAILSLLCDMLFNFAATEVFAGGMNAFIRAYGTREAIAQADENQIRELLTSLLHLYVPASILSGDDRDTSPVVDEDTTYSMISKIFGLTPAALLEELKEKADELKVKIDLSAFADPTGRLILAQDWAVFTSAPADAESTIKISSGSIKPDVLGYLQSANRALGHQEEDA